MSFAVSETGRMGLVSDGDRAAAPPAGDGARLARERIENIAAKFKTTPEVIREANAIPPNMHPKAGSTVLVPKPPTAPDKDIGQEVADNAMLAVEPDEPPRKKISIKVGKRDNIDSIARRYKVKVAEIRQWNQLKHDKLTPGQSLKLEVRVPKKAKGKAGAEKTADSKRPAHGASEHKRTHR